MKRNDWQWPRYSEEEAAAIGNLLLSNRVNYWTGEEGRRFEEEYAAWVGAAHAIALANGTIALELALRSIGIGPGDDVVVTPRTFIASASSIVTMGARPIFADVDRDSQNITAETVDAVLTEDTRAILCVHLAGWPCDMPRIVELARARNVQVIEDCAQAHGAHVNGQSVGSFGVANAWSFCQDKIMTTGGEGGMVTTNSSEVWKYIWSYKDHGKSWDAVYEKVHPPGFRWLHESFGTNGRMTEIQAILGRVQLQSMSEWHAKRLKNATSIWESAAELEGIRVPEIPDSIEHAAYRCYVFVEPERLKPDWHRDRIIHEVNERGVPCFSGSCSEIYLEKAFNGTDSRPCERLPVARELGETSLAFLTHPTLSSDAIAKTCEVLRDVMKGAMR